jgi:ABC-type bacteriocin/lantibiotic exporter with double-glycine peptidase domain
MSTEFELFEGKSFSDLMKDIYHNSKKKDRQINTLIQELQPLIKNIGDATVIVPLIKEYLDVSVKNDEHLVKLAAVVQRLVNSSTKLSDVGDEYGMTEAEKERLLEIAENELKEIQKEQDDLAKKELD